MLQVNVIGCIYLIDLRDITITSLHLNRNFVFSDYHQGNQNNGTYRARIVINVLYNRN